VKLADHNKVQLTQVPGHRHTKCIETANHLARVGFECPFTGPEPACSIPTGAAKRAVVDWTNRDHKNTESQQQNSNMQGPCQKNLGTTGTRNQLWWVIGLLTGHYHLIGHLSKLGLISKSIFNGVRKKLNQPHVLCDCEAIGYVRFCHL
jgi:hypothetical protein